MFILHLPYVQNKITNTVVDQVTKSVDGDISIDRTSIDIYRGLELNGIVLTNADQDTLLTLRSAKISPKNTLLTLINKDLSLNDIILEGAHIRIHRRADQRKFNWASLVDEDKEKDESKSQPVPPQVSKLRLKDFEVDLDDELKNEQIKGHFKSLELDISDAMFGDSIFLNISRVLIDEPSLFIQQGERTTEKDLSETNKKEVSSIFPNLRIGEMMVLNGDIHIRKEGRTQFEVNALDLNVANVIVTAIDDWDLVLRKLSGRIGEDEIDHVSARKVHSKNGVIKSDNTVLNINKSRLELDLTYDQNKKAGFPNIATKLRPSKVVLSDLYHLIPDLRDIFEHEPIANKVWQLEGDFVLEGNEIRGDQIALWLNGKHHFQGNVAFDKAEDIASSLLNVSVVQLHSDLEDLNHLSSKFKLPKELTRLKRVDFVGSFDGFLNDFVANGVIESPLGGATMDIKFDLSGKDDDVSYEGFLSLDSFDLRSMTLNEDFGYANAEINISNGHGKDLSSSNADINAVIDQFEFRGFSYKDATYVGKLSSQVIDGKFQINDEALQFEFDGVVDVSNSKPIFNFNIGANKINFCQLNLTEFPCELSFSSEINFQGSKLSDFEGSGFLKDVILKHDTSSLAIQRIDLSSLPSATSDKLKLSSDYIDFEIDGKFNLIDAVQQVVQSVLRNVPDHNEVWNVNIDQTFEKEQHYDFKVKLKDATPLFEFINQDITQTGIAEIRGKHHKDDVVFLYADFPFIQYNDIAVDDFSLAASASGGSFSVDFSTQNVTRDNVVIERFGLNSFAKGNTINWAFNMAYDDVNRAEVRASSKVEDNGYFTTFLEDYILVDSVLWDIKQSEGVGVYPRRLRMENFMLSDGLRYIQLKDIDEKGVEVAMNQFALDFINPIIDYDKTILTGNIDSRIRLENIYDQVLISGFLEVPDFKVNGDDFGQLLLKGKRDDFNSDILRVDLSIEKDTQNLYAVGSFNTESSALDVDVTLEDYPMSFFEYIIEEGISGTRGTTDINAKVFGTLDDLKMSGKSLVKNAGTRVDYIGAYYQILDQTVLIDENFIDFSNVELVDEMGNTADVAGGLRHDFLADIKADLRISSPYFIGLNTSAVDNPMYYGLGVGDIDMTFQGPFEAIDIRVTGILEGPSKLAIPLATTAYELDQSFIVFSNQDTLEKKNEESLAEILKAQGADFEMNLTFTPDAVVSIIYDEANGNILEGNGEGNLRIGVKRDGAFTAYGNFDILGGNYLYTAYGLIAKPFVIRNGGTVTWTGDPLNATLDVVAEYPGLRAPLTNFLSEYGGASIPTSDLSVRRDIDLSLILQGALFEPSINFDIDFPSLTGTMRTLAQDKVRTLKATENGINNQVVGLLLLRDFVNDNNGLAQIGANTIGQSGNNTITQFLTNQLSRLVSDYLGSKLGGENDIFSSIDFEFAVAQSSSPLGDAGLISGLLDVVPEEYQINLRNQFKNENFVLNIGGNYVRENEFVQAQNYVTGDFSLDWYLRDDRRLKLRFYGSYDYDEALSRRQRYGFGLNYRKEFGNLRGLQKALDEMIEEIQNKETEPAPADVSGNK